MDNRTVVPILVSNHIDNIVETDDFSPPPNNALNARRSRVHA